MWWIIGVIGYIYIWTSEYDMELIYFLFAFVAGFLGAFIWLILGFVFYEWGENIIIFKKRK